MWPYPKNLKGATLVRPSLLNADLTYANSDNTNLGNADLRGANLCHARFTKAHMKRAKLDGAYPWSRVETLLPRIGPLANPGWDGPAWWSDPSLHPRVFKGPS